MKLKRHRHENLDYHGDWHTKLMTALRLAQEGTSTPELLEAFRHLRDLLAMNDECKHMVSVRHPFPLWLDAAFVATCIRDYLEDDAAAIDISEPGYVTVQMVKRGTADYANGWVASEVERGIRHAKFLADAPH